ncbi:MAG TPA: metallophosphoesterase [Aeromicrobium sp.]|nr:metallophosphoesterase [Aeromicrobium sp.]
MTRSEACLRIAAVGDVHMADDLRGRYAPALAELTGQADVLLVAGDLTQHGTLDEAAAFAEEFATADVPVVAVLGNHDHHSGLELEIAELIGRTGITVLEGEGVALDTQRGRIGVAGAKGFCLGFTGRCAANFGETQMKAFTQHGIDSAALLRQAFDQLDEEEPQDIRVALTHFAPTTSTLRGEPAEIWPFLGNHLLGEVIDEVRADFAVHGHAHDGSERGTTERGIPVRNVAQPVIRSAYRIYEIPVRVTAP